MLLPVKQLPVLLQMVQWEILRLKLYVMVGITSSQLMMMFIVGQKQVKQFLFLYLQLSIGVVVTTAVQILILMVLFIFKSILLVRMLKLLVHHIPYLVWIGVTGRETLVVPTLYLNNRINVCMWEEH